MNKLLKGTVVIALTALGLPTIAAANDGASRCGTEKLDGLFVFSASGYTIVGGVPQPKAIVEVILFNGDGTLFVPDHTRSINGVIAAGPGGAGTYSLDSDCVGSIAFGAAGGPTFDLFMSPKGKDGWMIQTNPNTVFQGKVVQVAP
jgi:hypothetical protein